MYKLNNDGFVWEIIQANQVSDCKKEVFILNDDNTETLLTDYNNIDPTKTYGIEVDFVNNIDNRAILTQLIVQYAIDEFETKFDVFYLVAMETYELQQNVLNIASYVNN